MRPNRISCVTLAVALASVGANCLAREIDFVDLTKVAARTDLRRPAPTQGIGRAHGGILADHRCSSTMKTMGALRTTLVSLDRMHYQFGDKPTFEVTVGNVGSTSLEIPFSPHLGDLQPEDPAQEFAYSELRVVLWIGAETAWSANTGGSVTLYGAVDHPDTMLTLNPGESVRIIGKGKFALPTDGMIIELVHSGHAANRAYAEVYLYWNETLVTPTARATVSREVCLREMRGHDVSITLTDPGQ